MDKYQLEGSELFPNINNVTIRELQFVKYFLDNIVDSNVIKDIEMNINDQDLDTFLINVIRKYEEMNLSSRDPYETFVDNDKRNIMGHIKGVELRDHKLLTDITMETLSMSPDDKSFLFFFQETNGIYFNDFKRIKIVPDEFGSFAPLILFIKRTHEKYLFDSNVDEEWSK